MLICSLLFASRSRQLRVLLFLQHLLSEQREPLRLLFLFLRLYFVLPIVILRRAVRECENKAIVQQRHGFAAAATTTTTTTTADVLTKSRLSRYYGASTEKMRMQINPKPRRRRYTRV